MVRKDLPTLFDVNQMQFDDKDCISPTFNRDIQNEVMMSPLRNMAFNTGVVSANRKIDRIEVFVGSPDEQDRGEDGVQSTMLKKKKKKTMLREPNQS